MTNGVVVNGIKARPIGINSSVKEKVELVLDPYGQTETLASVSGGQIGGYQSFISQVLEPAQKNLSALAQTFVLETNTIQKNGIDGYGQMGADLFAFDPASDTPAAGIRLAVNDSMRIATAAQFRVGEGNTNITTTRATVKFTDTTPLTQLSNSQFVNNPNASAGVTFKADGARVYAPVTALSAGVKAAFYLDEADPGQQLQVLTRDGRQLLGQALTETEKYQLFTPQNGFAANANYSDAYLNQTGNKAYRGLDMFYGSKAEVLFGQNFDQFGAAGEALPLAAAMETARISSGDAHIPAGAITLNGLALSAFDANADSEITIASLNLGDPATGYEFQAVFGEDLITSSIDAADTGSLIDFAAALNTDLQDKGLLVTLINNNTDIRIIDSRGRDVSGVALTPNSTLTGADSGVVNVNSAAVQLANWINGTSQARVLNPMFGLPPEPGFSEFQATIGGVSFNLTPTTATDLSSLAAALQQQFRQADDSSDISVLVDRTHLQITDAQGRSFKNFALIPADPDSLATGGKIEIVNSNVSQTNIRAEVFSEVRVPVSQINLSKPLTINGQAITGFGSVNDLVNQINASDAGVVAAIKSNGEFVITDPLGSPIRINSTLDGNALNMQPTTYNGQVRMVQVIRDMRIAAPDINFEYPLTINGVNLSEATYLASPFVSPVVEFGYPTKSISEADSLTLVKALNSVTSISEVISPQLGHALTLTLSIDGDVISLENMSRSAQKIGFTADPYPDGTIITVGGVDITLAAGTNGADVASDVRDALLASDEFSGYSITLENNELVFMAPIGDTPIDIETAVQMGGVNIDLTADALTIATLEGEALANEVKNKLSLLGYDIKVEAQGGGLVFSNTLELEKELTLVSLSASEIGTDPLVTVVAGSIDDSFSKSYKASLNDAGAIVITSVKDNVVDQDIKNSFLIRSAGIEVAPQNAITTVQGLAERITAKSDQTGVVASIDFYGDLILSTIDKKGTSVISIGPGKDANGNQVPNALGLDPMDFDVTARLKRKLENPDFVSDIRISFGSYGDPAKFGDPADLAKMGLRTGAYIEDGCPDELLLFMTGKGAAKVAVGFEGKPDNVRDSLRSQSLTLKFTATDRYTIVDAATGTQLADRHYDSSVLEPVVEFQGLQIKLSHAPAVGDSYKIDGNFDGLGNNVNMLAMVDLNKKPTANGKTLANTYIDQINNVGNLAQQAIITQEALTVVNEQAVAARDKVSGVNLDDEAAALIRYQQAYQACAKALQVSGELFDAIVQIR
jgi:flagellar hook-associated protein FlgK